ncbi:cell division protein ZipA [Salinisphaera sp. T31B1]|uniref:cell division protein ZipA n=1 Tax=Salinisphaera sp. T31B1 TaxID=727963 RepID=UPI00333F1D2D
MSIVQWFLLILVIAVVGGAYWYLRRQSANDPWQGMEEDAPVDDEALDRGESLGGDSYIVGVRTLSKETPASRKAGHGASAPPPVDEPEADELNDAAAEASWRAYKERAQERPAEVAAPVDDAPESEQPPASAAASLSRPSGERVEDIRPQRPPADGQQHVFILHVATPDGRFFDGPDIHAALTDEGLKFGLNDIYHRVTETNGIPESVFAVANMLKPGTLDPVDQDHLATPGLTFFLVLPGPIDGMPAMREMMETANRIAEALGGEVLDDKRALLKAQTAQYMLDQIADIDRRAKIAQRR